MNDEEIRALKRQLEAMNKVVANAIGDRQTILFEHFAAEYLKNKLLNPSLRAATKNSFRNQVLNHLIPAFGRFPLDKLSNAEWLKWVTELRADETRPRKVTRFFNARKNLAEILLAAKEQGHIDKAPKLDNPDEPKDAGRLLTDKEIVTILWYSNRPFRFIFYTLWKMGCRPREILKWEWSMIRWGEPGKAWIDIPARISKCNRSRSIPINPRVSMRLAIRKRVGNHSEFVFPSRDPRKSQVSYMAAWTRACREGNISKTVPYDFRRTFITRCAIEGLPLIYVAKALDTSTTMIESTYAKANADVMESVMK